MSSLFPGRGLSNRAPVARSHDFIRVRDLPVRGEEGYPPGLTAELTRLCATPAGQKKGVSLREVQAKALYDLGTHKHGFFPLRVGTGKTLLSFLAPRMVTAKRPVLLLPAALVEKTDREWRKAALDWKVATHLQIRSYEFLGRVSGANWIETYRPDMIIADECFTGETQIRTEFGLKRIDDVIPGERVWSLGSSGLELCEVLGVGERESDEIYCVRFGDKEYFCTGAHPWLTIDGWKPTARLAVGDEILRDMREGVHLQAVQEASVLLSSVQTGEPSIEFSGFLEDARNESGAFSEDEWDVAAGRSGQGFGKTQRDRTSAESAWGQRARIIDPAGAFAEGFRRWLDFGDALPLGSLGHSGVARGYCSQGGEDSRGSRWGQPRGFGRTGERRAKARVLRGVGLDGVTSVERVSGERLGSGCSVYNLHVESTNNYILSDGHVVHNCHRLKSRRAAVTRRVERYMKANPGTIFVPMSGTIMKKSVKDFAHLLEWSHGQSSPLPLYQATLIEWAEALDEGLNAFQQRAPGVLVDLCPWSKGSTPPPGDEAPNAHARRVFQKRLQATTGVVVADTVDDFTGSLVIEALEYSPNAQTEANFQILRETMCRPDGWALAEAMQGWAVARQLALGLHYAWDPSPPQDWLDARKAWASFVRETLASPDALSMGIDSELQVANAVLREELEDEFGVLAEWRRLKPTFTVNPKDVWHDDSALKVCVEWVKNHPRGIVWCEHQFFARTLSKMAGVPYYGAQGLDAQGNFIEDHVSGPVIASIAANCTGRNLQHKWHENLVTAPPSDSERWEQLIARTHRPGQTEDTVTVDVLVGCREHLESVPRALASSDIKTDLLGFSQKLRIADLVWPDAQGKKGFRWT